MRDKFSYKELFDLSGRTALITGASGFLGRYFSSGLAESGANVALLDISAKAVHEQAKELSSRYGVKVISYVCDVSEPCSVQEVVGRVIADFGRIDVLHNNAAGKSDDMNAFFAPFEDYLYDEWRKITAVNLDSMFLMAQIVGRQMLKQGSGSIIQTSSIYGLLGPDQSIYEESEHLGHQINSPAVYATTKAGIIGLTRYLATYWADKGIRVNAIAPGGVESGQNNKFITRYSKRIPMRRMAQPHEIVGALLYLASDASSYVTGQVIPIDGGLTAW